LITHLLKYHHEKTVKMKKLLLPLIVIGILICGVSQPVKAAGQYIFSTFRDDGVNPERLWIYTSADGLNYNLLSQTGYGGPTGVVRDPSIMKHTDGKYYVCHTVQSWETSSTYFAIASSSNLINWTNVATVNAGVSGTYYTWAPEWFVDGDTVKIIASLGPQGSSFKPYVFTAQNSALTSWSSAVDMGIGTNHIDTFVVKDGDTYHAFAKDESSKYIEHATSSSLTSGWSWVGTGNWAGWGSGKEGPCVFQLEDGTWRIFMDAYSPKGGTKTATSSNLNSWSALSSPGPASEMALNQHGTVIFVPEPSTLALLATCMAGLLFMRCVKKGEPLF
jgi:hypothetical protein